MVSRGSINRLLNDLRSIEAGSGIESAAADGLSLTLRVPYAMGIACSAGVSPLIVSLLPRDPNDSSAFAGFAWRRMTTGAYSFVGGGALPTLVPPPSATCTAQGVIQVPASGPTPAGTIVSIPWGTPDTAQRAGSTVVLYQRVRYRFAPSVAVDSAVGLFRAVRIGAAWEEEELAAPFDAQARFGLIMLGQDTAATVVPGGPWPNARGIQVDLGGMSESNFNGERKYLHVRTAVFFKNRTS